MIIFCLLFSYACASQEDKLFEATKDGNIDLVKELVKNGVDVNCNDQNDQNPLHHACYLGHLDIARVLIDNGATNPYPAFDSFAVYVPFITYITTLVPEVLAYSTYEPLYSVTLNPLNDAFE